MNTSATNVYDFPWEEHYAKAVLELDQARLQKLIERAEEAILARAYELNGRLGHTIEMQLVQDALRYLDVLKM